MLHGKGCSGGECQVADAIDVRRGLAMDATSVAGSTNWSMRSERCNRRPRLACIERDDKARLRSVEIGIDQCWDLLARAGRIAMQDEFSS